MTIEITNYPTVQCETNILKNKVYRHTVTAADVLAGSIAIDTGMLNYSQRIVNLTATINASGSTSYYVGLNYNNSQCGDFWYIGYLGLIVLIYFELSEGILINFGMCYI